MKVAIDIRNIGKSRTGSEVVVLQLVKHLLQQDQHNEYYLLTDTDDSYVLDYIHRVLMLEGKDHVRIVCLWSPHRSVWLFWQVALFVRKMEIDLFHTEYIVPFFIPRTTRVFTHIHDVSFADPTIRPLIGKKDLFILDLLIGRSLRRADRIIAVSAFTRDQIKKYYAYQSPKVVLIYNALGYDMTDVNTSATDSLRISEKYDLPQRYIFALGTMQPRKNIPFLIEAFARCAAEIPRIDLVLSGPRNQNFDEVITQTLEQYPEIAKRVYFTGYIEPEDLPGVYQGAMCSVHPSLYEGFGLPLLESFWSGVPVAASDIPVYREIASGGALYFDPREIDRCCEVLYTICTDNRVRSKLLEQAENQKKCFSWKESADLFLDLYERDV